jgi:hypothetical protein
MDTWLNRDIHLIIHPNHGTPKSWHTQIMAHPNHGTPKSWHTQIMTHPNHGTPKSWHTQIMANPADKNLSPKKQHQSDRKPTKKHYQDV